MEISYFSAYFGDHAGYVCSQWEATLQSSIVSHWLSPYPEWSQFLILKNDVHGINYEYSRKIGQYVLIYTVEFEKGICKILVRPQCFISIQIPYQLWSDETTFTFHKLITDIYVMYACNIWLNQTDQNTETKIIVWKWHIIFVNTWATNSITNIQSLLLPIHLIMYVHPYMLQNTMHDEFCSKLINTQVHCGC